MSYLTLKANSASKPSTFTPDWISIGAGGMQYRAVGATNWTNATQGTAITVDTTGIELKADTIQTSDTHHFSMTGSISASGDVTSLTNGVGGDCALADNCYDSMFKNCTSLTTAPALPATTLADWCYSFMFHGCSALVTVPVLPATILVKSCYWGMFHSCSALVTAPVLLATTLADNCYRAMFYNCSSLRGYITPEPDYTLIHNHPSTTAFNWSTAMYFGLNSASTVPDTPSSNVNYYFKPATPPTPTTVEGKKFECIGAIPVRELV